MAKTLYSQSGKIEYGIKKYTVDTEADKEALNLRTTKMGSKCYVMDTKKWYILNSSNQWIPFVGEGGSGGSGSPFNIKGSVPTIDDLPTEDNAIGDLYIVQEDHSEWVWLTNSEHPEGHWEQVINSESFIIQVEVNDETYQSDKTYSEIRQAYDTGKIIFVILDEYEVYQLTVATDKEFSFTHCYVLATKDQIAVNTLTIFSDNKWIMSEANALFTPQVIEILESNPAITPVKNTIYKCGELSSLTIVDPPTNTSWSVVFTSGSTPTTTTIPANILGLGNFAAEPQTVYEINVLDNRAIWHGWAVNNE